VEKIRRRLEMEKQELQAALEEAESTLEQEEAKVARAQMEIQGIRSEIDRRIAEKEEEFENTRYVIVNDSSLLFCFILILLIKFTSVFKRVHKTNQN